MAATEERLGCLASGSILTKFLQVPSRTTCDCLFRTPTGAKTPLQNHLKFHLQLLTEYKDSKSEQQPTLLHVAIKHVSLEKKQAPTTKTAEMTVLDVQPCSVVEDCSFTVLMKEYQTVLLSATH